MAPEVAVARVVCVPLIVSVGVPLLESVCNIVLVPRVDPVDPVDSVVDPGPLALRVDSGTFVEVEDGPPVEEVDEVVEEVSVEDFLAASPGVSLALLSSGIGYYSPSLDLSTSNRA